MAAEQGFAKAQLYLAMMYQFGEGVKKNEEKAVKLYRLAAEEGLAEALSDLTELKDKHHPVAAYHLAMMEADALNIKRLMCSGLDLI